MKSGGKSLTIDPRSAANAVKRHLQRLKSSTNGVQFTAQMHESEMVELLVSIARCEDYAAPLRRQCAVDVITFARGVPRPWLHNSETIDPQAEGSAGLGATVGQELEAATLTADLHRQLNEYMASNVHPRDWPENVRSVAGDMIAYYEKEDTEAAG